MKSLFDTIRDTWNAANVDPADPITSFEMEARKLEEQLSKRIEPFLAQFNDGLISASELTAQVILQASIVPDKTE